MNTDFHGRSVTLCLTESCNLSCTYCYEHSKTSKGMSFETARKIIDSEIKDLNEKIVFDLFGGEPFLKFKLIQQIYEYVKSKHLNNWVMFATTNGTFVHGKIKQWLIENRDHFVTGLSVDGTKKMQDINRSNSFDLIDLNFFVKNYPNQPIKMTISQETINTLSEGVIYLHNLGFKVNCNLAFGIDWSSENNVKVLNRELKKLIDFYLENPKIVPCSLLNMNFDSIAYDVSCKVVHKWCGTGVYMHCYDVNGDCYPCQFFMPISAGKGKEKRLGEIDFKTLIPIEILDDKC